MTTILRRTVVAPLTSKSRAKFFGDFYAELARIIALLDTTLTREIPLLYTLDSLITGTNEIKLRICDESTDIEKIVNVILRYHHDDEKYGNIHIEIAVSQLSQRNKSHFLGKYLITNHKKITKDVVKAVIEAMRMI